MANIITAKELKKLQDLIKFQKKKIKQEVAVFFKNHFAKLIFWLDGEKEFMNFLFL